ncbi:TolC family protein, partial [Acidithiobacillus caldus]
QLPMGLLGRRPDIVAARWAVRAAAAQVGAARAAFYPNINLRLLAGWNSIHLADLFDPGNFAHAVGPAITLPIFEGGALRAQLRSQNAVFLAAQDHYRATILNALRQVADVLSEAQRLQRDAAALRAQWRSQRNQWLLQRSAWRSGLASRLPSLEARIQLQRTREAETVDRTRRLQNWVLLESALGGGYTLAHEQQTKEHDG